MPAAATRVNTLDRARKLADATIDADAILAKLGARGQSALAKRLEKYDQTHPARAQAYRKLAALMGALAPARPRALGRAIQFFIPDGPYFLQVFSLDDGTDGTLTVCCEDLLSVATKAGLFAAKAGQPRQFAVSGTTQTLLIDQIDSKTENPPVHCKSMTGWNRKAMNIMLPESPTREQVNAVAVMCALTALRWHEAKVA